MSCVNESSSTITVSNIFSGSTSSAFSFGVLNFLSPPSAEPSDIISITSISGTANIDTCSVYATGLTPASFSNFSISAAGTMVVNSYIGVRSSFTLLSSISQTDTFLLTFPSGSTLSYTNLQGSAASYVSPPTIVG